MKSVILNDVNKKIGHVWGNFLLTACDKKNGKFIPLTSLNGCRSFMCDVLFMHKNPTYKSTYDPSYPFNHNWDKGFFYVLFIGEEKNVNKHLNWLWDKEDKAKVRRTVLHSVKGHKNMFIAEGSRWWKESCWKMMLYTFYLKTMTYKNPRDCDDLYWEALEKLNKKGVSNEDVLLSRVKCRKEIFHPSVYGENNNVGRHSREGFVSICNGFNRPMAKYLGVNDE